MSTRPPILDKSSMSCVHIVYVCLFLIHCKFFCRIVSKPHTYIFQMLFTIPLSWTYNYFEIYHITIFNTSSYTWIT